MNNNISSICLYWSQTKRPWGTSDWTWSDCESAIELCNVWGTYSSTWMDANSWWSACFGSGSIPPIPPTPVSSGSFNTYGVDATTLIQPWLIEPWNPYRAGEIDKKKRLIKLICKVKGQTYEEEKEVGTMNVSVDDVKLVVKKVLNIDLDVKKLEE